MISKEEVLENSNDKDFVLKAIEETPTLIEFASDELRDDKEVMLEAIKKAHIEIKKMCKFISDIKTEIGKPKFEYQSFSVTPEFYKAVCENFEKAIILQTIKKYN